MVPEAPLEQTDAGLVPKGEGWFVVNAKEARWFEHEKFGSGTVFEGEPEFKELGINIGVLEPGQPACLYHRENAQENFLVLRGECLLLVEGEERPLKAWDFVHCPPWTDHVFVGAGDGPCAILMVGTRSPDHATRYLVDPVAARYGVSVPVETGSSQEAYPDRPPFEPVRSPWPLSTS
jgi:uncharacterized cupin superfamily protein